jgi:hypothetical protein
VDLAPWATVIGGLSGLGGLAAMLKVRAEKHKTAADAAATLSDSAVKWIARIEETADKAIVALDEFKAEQTVKDTARAAADRARDARLRVHEQWDRQIVRRFEDLTGERFDAPPPLTEPVHRPEPN